MLVKAFSRGQNTVINPDSSSISYVFFCVDQGFIMYIYYVYM